MSELHQKIEAAGRDAHAIVCIDARVKAGIPEEEAKIALALEYKSVYQKHGVTEDQVFTWIFDRVYTTVNGQKCKCAECVLNRKRMKIHLALERSC